MTAVCEICGDVGYGHLLLSCDHCKCAMHQYCLAKVLFDRSLLERWFCDECLPKRSEVTYEGSLQKAPKHARSGSAVRRASTTSVRSTREAEPCRNHKSKSEKSKSKSGRKKGSDMQPMGKKTITRDGNAPNVSCASAKALHSCEVMTIETSEASNEENQQVDHGHSVHTLNNVCVANCLPARVKQINLQNPSDEFEPPLGDARQLNPPKDSDCLSSGNVEIENPKGSHVTPFVTRGNQSVPSTLLDRVDSGSFPGTNLKEIILLEDSNTSAELFYTVGHCVKDNRGKQIQLIILDDNEEEAADVQSEDYNHRSLECDGSLSKRRIGMEDCVEQAVQAGDLNGQNLNAVHLDILIPESSEITQPVKKRRRNIEANEDNKDEEVLIGSSNRKCALDDVSKLTSETSDATDPVLRSRMAFDSEFANQQCSMYSQPIDEPIWSGILKINNEFISLTAHLSTKACGFVRELSRSLQPVVQVIKLPELEAWPQSWRTSRPTDGDIALYFFPPSASPNEESDGPVEEIIDSGAVLQAVIGVAELLIFPSTILPAQYHLCQGKRYLWGVFKRREDESDKDHLVEEQDGSACAEEGEIQEHNFMDRQYEVQCESPDHETSVVEHVMHVEDQLLVEQNCEWQEATRNATMGLHSPGNNSSPAEPNPSKARSNCFTQTRAGSKLDVTEEVDHLDEQNFTKPSADSAGPAAATPRSIDSAECGAAPPMTQLFGFVTARTPRAQKLIQEMVSEGALVFSLAQEIATARATVGNNIGAQVHLAPDSASPPMQERCQSTSFVPLDDDMASEACLELFPVRQEHIRWTPRVETSKEVDLDLSLSARSRASSGSLL